MRFPGVRWHKLPAAGLLLAAGLILIGWRTPPVLGRLGTPAPAAARVGLSAPVAALGRVVGLARMPVHLWQWNPAPSAFYSPMGCGAFTTAMALSVFQPARFGSYAAAGAIEAAMPVIPLVGGTPESANAVAARAAGFPAAMLDHGTVAELRAAIDSNAPVILLVDPLLGLGRHDVLLVGYGLDAAGEVTVLFVDNPALARADGADPDHPGAPGNSSIRVSDLGSSWTGVFTPIFSSGAAARHWVMATGR